MNKNNKHIEILAPAGSIDILYSVVSMGADAVYVGGPRFGARAFADNPSVDELCEAIYLLHQMDKKLYLTVNTLVYDDEFEALSGMLDPLVRAGLDAVIVQDVGVVRYISHRYPNLDIHASTQMAVISADETGLFSRICDVTDGKYGNITRIVPARELSIDEIRQIRNKTDLEIEVFVHGANCVCYSGWCLMSEHIGDRSGNRGMCAGPCRLKFKTDVGERYALNAKDSMTLMHIPELVDAGIDSFKIEGRMKSKQYASYMAYLYRRYTDVYIEEGADRYRELIDDESSELHRDMRRAMDLYNRGGTFPSFLFTKTIDETIEPMINGHQGVDIGEVTSVGRGKADIAFTKQVNPHDVVSIRRGDKFIYEFTLGGDADNKSTVNIGHSDVRVGDKLYRIRNNKLLSDIDGMIEDARSSSKIPLDIRFDAHVGEKLRCEISSDMSVSVEGDVVGSAINRPVTEEDIFKKLTAISDTPYRFDTVEISVDDDVFFPISSVKDIRRRAISEYEETKGLLAEAKSVIVNDDAQDGFIDIKKSNNIKSDNLPYNEVWYRIESMREFDDIRLSLINNPKQDDMINIIWLTLEGFDKKDIPLLNYRLKVINNNKTHSNIRLAFSLPRPLHGTIKKLTDEVVGELDVGVFDAFVANSLASIAYRDRLWPDIPTYADINLYMTNTYAKCVYEDMNIKPMSVVVGRAPIMTTKHRIVPGSITTPKGDRFYVVNHPMYGYSSVYAYDRK